MPHATPKETGVEGQTPSKEELDPFKALAKPWKVVTPATPRVSMPCSSFPDFASRGGATADDRATRESIQRIKTYDTRVECSTGGQYRRAIQRTKIRHESLKSPHERGARRRLEDCVSAEARGACPHVPLESDVRTVQPRRTTRARWQDGRARRPVWVIRTARLHGRRGVRVAPRARTPRVHGPRGEPRECCAPNLKPETLMITYAHTSLGAPDLRRAAT